MKQDFITEKTEQTKKMGEMLAKELRGGEVICLKGELGAGKTTFTQGLLRGLGAKGPYTSPTFLVMKEYDREQGTVNSEQKIRKVYHIDAYRVSSDDILDLGWEEIINDKNNVIIVEWADRISDIVPKKAVWIEFFGVDENRRKITIKI